MTMEKAPPAVLITRPEADAAETALHLENQGYKPILSPVLSVLLQTFTPPAWENVSGLIITSANALSATFDAGLPKNIPIFVVGARSHQRLMDQGFTNLHGPVLQSSELPQLIQVYFNGKTGKLVHLTATHGEKEFYAALRANDFSVDSIHVYQAQAATTLSAECLSVLRNGTLKTALFYSPRSAAVFAQLLSHAGLAHMAPQLAALCLSPAVADVCRNAGFAPVITAEKPTQDSLLDCLAKHAHSRHSNP